MDPTTPQPTQRKLAAYFTPLALQAAAQSLTYPLVAMVASNGPGGTLNLAGVAQSNIIMFLVGTLGAGLMTSGMVFGASREGYARFVSVNKTLSLAAAVILALCCIPAASDVIFGVLLGLPESIQTPARQALPFTVLINLLFFARNPWQVLLYNNGASGRASMATFLRIGLTLALAPVFCSLGLVGPRWAMVCQAGPIAVEAGVSWYYSRPFAAALVSAPCPVPTRREILWFNLPLTIGGFLMTASGMLLGAVIARAGNAEHILPAYYLALGLANPVTYAASRLQNVVLCFPPQSPRDVTTLKFSAVAGLILGLIPLLFLLPGLREWYYISLQRLPHDDMALVNTTALMLTVFPLVVALRSHREGIAALDRRTPTILAGNASSVAALALTATAALALGLPGNIIGPLALVISNLAGLGAVVLLLREGDRRRMVAVPQVGIGQEG